MPGERMTMAQELITSDGEVMDGPVQRLVPDNSNLSVMLKAELDTAITTARAFPRSMKVAIDRIRQLATLDEATAEECIYALKRGSKTIRGPSVRMAEIIAQQWGNNRVDARVIQIDRVNKVIVAEATFHDLETNTANKATIQRRISNSNGALYNDDMIVMTGNAACSIARRNAVLAGVPKGIWAQGLLAAEQVVRGDEKTLTERRDAAVKAFAHFGMTPAQVFQVMHVKGIDDIGLDELVTLRGTFSALKNGETTVEEVLRSASGAPAASDHKKVANPLADEAPPEKAADPVPEGATEKKATEKAVDAQAATKAEAPTPIELARQKGAEARRGGKTRKALPGEYRDEARKAEADAWFEGYEAEGDAN